MPLNKDPLPMFAGILTFLRVPHGDLEDLQEGMIAIAGVTYDLSNTARIGSRFGPRNMRETSTFYAGSIETGSEVIEVTTKEVVRYNPKPRMLDLGDLNVYPVDWPKTEASLRRAMREITRRGAFPVILGGDNFITTALIQGYKDAVVAKGGRRVGYIQLSRNLDLGKEDPVWGNVWRGATARQIIEMGAVDPRNMVWVGPHGYVRAEEWVYAQELNARVFTLKDIRKQGILPVMRQAVDIAGAGCDGIYVSVDLDVVDGCYTAGTAVPNLDGVRDVELVDAMDVLWDAKVGAVGVVGVNPTVEFVYHTSQRIAVTAILRLIAPRIAAVSPTPSVPART
ncbi:MAG: arginase family protein [Chloroflexi bacterium]|nr:arginase family protein [Chloroflexota bacterium]